MTLHHWLEVFVALAVVGYILAQIIVARGLAKLQRRRARLFSPSTKARWTECPGRHRYELDSK